MTSHEAAIAEVIIGLFLTRIQRTAINVSARAQDKCVPPNFRTMQSPRIIRSRRRRSIPELRLQQSATRRIEAAKVGLGRSIMTRQFGSGARRRRESLKGIHVHVHAGAARKNRLRSSKDRDGVLGQRTKGRHSSVCYRFQDGGRLLGEGRVFYSCHPGHCFA